jgi:hypothetical protein
MKFPASANRQTQPRTFMARAALAASGFAVRRSRRKSKKLMGSLYQDMNLNAIVSHWTSITTEPDLTRGWPDMTAFRTIEHGQMADAWSLRNP